MLWADGGPLADVCHGWFPEGICFLWTVGGTGGVIRLKCCRILTATIVIEDPNDAKNGVTGNQSSGTS